MQRILPIVLSVIFMSQQVFAQIAGIVFRDYNRNGIRESVAPSVEPLVEGVTIETYDASNTLISSTVSASDGTYTMPFTVPVRLEFKIPSGLPCLNNLNDFSGAGSYGNNVRFINSSSSNINYAIQGMNEYISTTNPDVFVPVFTDGDPLGFGTAAMSTCFRSHSYTSTGNAMATRTLAASQLGSVWGVAYSKQAKKIFTSAFLKRQVGLGPLGTGGIYMLQPTSTSFSVTNFFDMDVMGFRTRASNIAPAYGNGTSFTINGGGTEATYLGATDPVSGAPIGLGVVGDNGTTGRNLPINSGGDANDPAAFDQVGKVGLGDIDISDDGKFLFVTNLYDRKLYRLELNDANNPTTVITITSYSLPSISVSNGVLRPFGISYYKDKVYLGAVATGENGGVNIVNGASDLFAYVFELNNPTGIASFNLSPVLTIPLNYTKGSAILNNAAASQWYPWSRNTSDVLTFSGEQTLPTPILSDIAFTERGDMVLNFMDRSGHQYGFQNYKNLTGTDLVSYDIGGDVLIAGKNCSNGTFTIENNGSFNSSGTTFNGGVSNTEGPGGGEFFSGEFYPVWHKETAMGSSTLMPGDNKLLITLMDPINDFSCGNGKFSTINASRSGMLEINNSTLPGSFAKANGLGDIELAGDSAPIEIGNRIWLDANENGIQDPSELGLANVSVELFADFNNDNMPDGASLGMTTTDVDGHYYFNQSNIPDGDPATSGNQAGLKPQSYYVIRISSSDWNVTFGIAELLEKGLTIDNIGGAGQPDWRDNDAVISAGIPQIQFLTGRVGQSDHSLDFGFKNCTANAGLNVFLSCSSPSATIGTVSVVGNNYSWSPATGLSSTNIAQPITSALSSITYTVSVTSSQTGCAKTSTVLVSVNKTPPSANAGTSPSLTCTTPSATLGTSSVAGNTYSWSPVTALSSTSISNPTTSATTSTTYTVTVTGTNGCTATSSVIVGVNKTPPTANAGTSPSLTCTTPSGTLGTSSVAGNTYSWSPVTALSSTSISNPTTTATTSTTYTVTVTGSNGCTATSSVLVGVNKTPPSANAGTSPSLTCTTPSATLGTSSVAGNTYSWSPVTALSSTTISNPITTATTSTTYTVTVTGSNGCTATSSVLVGVNKTPPSANAGTSPSLTCTTPSATLGTSSVAGNTYSWSPVTALSSTSISNPTTTATTSTTYTVTVTGSNGCTATSSVLVGVNKTPPSANAGTSPSLTCTTPSATLGTSSVAGNTYSWSPVTALSSTSISNPTTSATTSTTYTVTVTGTNGCTATSSVIVGVNKTPPTANAGTSPSLTCTTPSGTLGTSSVAGNTYSWSPVTALSSTSISNPTTTATTSTTYTVTVTGSNGCTATSSVLVGVNKTPPSANAGTSPSLTCTTPSATIGTSSVAGNTYSWLPSTALSSTTISNPTTSATTSTTYTVTVTGSNGCTATSSVLVGVNKTPPSANAGTSPSLTCTTPSAVIGATNVAGNTYSWSPVTALSSTTISNPTTSATTSSTYTVTVTGSNGCTATSSVLVGVNKTPPAANAGTSPSLTCTTPSATIGTTNVAGNTYSWSPGTALSSTSISNPTTTATTSTTYTVTVTGSNGCTATSSVLVGVNKTPPTANAGTSPSLTCTTPSATIGTNSVAGNIYSWSPVTALSSTTISNPTTSATTSTTYTVTVTGSNGCTATSSVLVGVNKTPPSANAGTSPSLTCTTPSATIGTSSVAGNTYSWLPSTALSSTTISNPTTSATTSTTYTVTVTGSNGCTATSSVLVGVNKTPPTANAGTSPSLTCTTPSATIGTNSVAGNIYSWSPVTALSSTTISNPTTSATTSTTYTVTVTGSNGCTATSSVLVGVNKTPPTANAGTSPSLTCTTPSATIGTTTVAGNTYSWSPVTALSSTTISNPTTSATTSTTYTVTVTGSNGCTATSSVIVGVNKTPPTANAGTSPSLTCTTPSGTLGTSSVAGNTYSWSPVTALSSTSISNPTTSATTSTTYTVAVTGSNGCTATSSVIVGVNKTPPTANAGTSPSLTCTTPSATIGTSSVTGNTYSWLPSTALSSTTISNPTTSATTSTTYTVTVTGSNGCTATSSVIVGVNKTPPSANAGTSPSLTCTTPSATIGTSSVAGNTYSWSPVTALSSTSISNPTTSASTSTTYTVTVTGSNGCTATSNVIVGVNKTPPTLSHLSADTLCLGESAELTASGAPQILWTDGQAQFVNSTIIFPNINTTYTVTGTSANGCTTSSTFMVKVNPLPIIFAQANPSTICEGNSLKLTTSSLPSILWSNGSALQEQVVSPLSNTTYTVTASDGLCVNTATVSVNVESIQNQVVQISSLDSNTHIDGMNLAYTSSNCQKMALISDAAGGNVLGKTIVNLTVLDTVLLANNTPYVRKWYAITPENNGPAAITLFYSQADFDDYNLRNTTFFDLPNSGSNTDPNLINIRVTKVSNGNLGIGAETLIIPTVNWNGSFWELSFFVDSFSSFYVHSIGQNTALPASEFKATLVEKISTSTCKVNWYTVDESNTSHFEIEFSTDGVQFEYLGKVQASYNFQGRKEYQYLDEQNSFLDKSIRYYRIKLTDVDGKIAYSNTISILSNEESEEINVYPIPFKDQLTFSLYSKESTNYQIELYDMNGRRLMSTLTETVQGEFKYILSDLDTLSDGIYFVGIKNLETNQLTNKKVIKGNR